MDLTTAPPIRVVLGQRFEVLRELGRGGMGVVFEVLDLETRQRMALKTLRSLSPDALLRFKNEFREFQDLHHPNLIGLGELFSEHNEWFFTMELIRGVNLLAYVRSTTEMPTIGPSAETLVRSANADTLVSSTPGGGAVKVAEADVANEPVDENRLRSTLRQLAEGLHALHQSGKVHRDIKPGNVLVTPEGRTVLLDFGLALDLSRREFLPEDNVIVGTVAYMAPEQASAQRVTPAADWHAFGVLLYEALTGRLPFTGSSIEILGAKQTKEAIPPHVLRQAVPRDLSELCVELLHFNPAARPNGQQVLERLGRRDERKSQERVSISQSLGVTSLIGRQRELEVLDHAWDRVEAGGSHAVLVSGESGLGKTALVRHFVHRIAQRGGVVLIGSCYERESVPFKAVDGAIDALSGFMLSLDPEEVERLLPPETSVLTQSFPVFGQVETLLERSGSGREVLDPLELRRQLFVGLRELFKRLGARRRVVLVIDDLQWADADSLTLLSELLRGPDEPRLLLVATLRATEAEEVSRWKLRLQQSLGERVDTVTLHRMNSNDAIELARALLRRQGITDADALAAAAVAEGGGHPLFIDELLRQVEDPSAPSVRLTLEDALWRRATQLDDVARSVLELVALSAGRSMQQTIAQASGVDRNQFARVMGQLRVSHLVRTSGMRATDTVEPFHDKVRVAVRAHVDAPSAQRQHRRLALALESIDGSDTAALTFHWREAGEPLRAGRFAELAADQAFRALAFDRSAEFLAQALALLAPEGAKANEMRARLGDALAKAGRGAEAAEVLLKAAATSEAVNALELNRLAAEQLLRSGHIDRGVATIREVLRVVGLELASSPMRALMSLGVSRARLALRRNRFEPTPARLVKPADIFRIDATWSAAAGLSAVDPIRASDLQTRNLLYALEAGEPYRVARALAMEAAFVGTGGRRAEAKAQALVERSAELASGIGEPHAIGLSTMIRGFIQLQNGKWAGARAALERAESVLRTQCVGTAWEVETAYLMRFESLFYLGDFVQLRSGVLSQIREADARRDRYASTNLRLAHMNFVWLIDDLPEGARAEAEQGMSRWSVDGYLAQHWYHLLAITNVDLYEGKGAQAWQRMREAWASLSKAMLLRVQLMRIEAWHLRARAAVMAGAHADAESCAKALASEGVPWATMAALSTRAAIAARLKDHARAGEQFEQALAIARELSMQGFAASLELRLAGLEGGARGSARQDRGRAGLAAQGVASPQRLADAMVPP